MRLCECKKRYTSSFCNGSAFGIVSTGQHELCWRLFLYILGGLGRLKCVARCVCGDTAPTYVDVRGGV